MLVMPGLDPGIHLLRTKLVAVMDCRVKPGNDGCACRWSVRLLPSRYSRHRRKMAEKPDKSNKLKARLPRGLGDRGPAEIAATRRMIEQIRAVYERYGFEPVETPAFEYTDALGKFLP